MDRFVDISIAFVLLAFLEVLVKPLAIKFGQLFFPRVAVEAFILADKLIPRLLAEGKTGVELEATLRKGLVSFTSDHRWETANLEALWQEFDVRKLLDHNKAIDS